MTGATRLAAAACARIGAGLVRVIAPGGTGDIYRAALPAHIIVDDERFEEFANADGSALYKSNHGPVLERHVRAVLVGPGCTQVNPSIFFQTMNAGHVNGIILDAGGFASWSGDRMLELQAFGDHERVAVTPHEGEFTKFFSSYEYGRPVLEPADKAGRAEAASEKISATVVLKGAQTVIAGSGKPIVQDRDVPWLASAGTGDVLSGMITGLVAQGMPLRPACAAAVWIHAEAGERIGPGLVASDLPDMIPFVLKDLFG